MDRTRRRLAVSLALLPLVSSLGRAAGEASAANSLRASAGAASPAPPLRYGEASPGPILRLQKDAPARIALQNGLARPTSLDLQGVRVAPPLGGSGPLGGAVASGATADVAFTPRDSGTFWFHPWILDPLEDATAQGLAGVLVVEEPAPPEVDADLVAILTDRWPLADPDAADPEALRIDGRPWPRSETLHPGSRIRLRLINASTRRALSITCAGTTPYVIAIDGQPSELFKPLSDRVPVGPGARFDLMFDLPMAGGAPVRLIVGSGTEAAMVIGTAGDARPAREPIRPLPANPLLPPVIPLERSTRATLVAQRRDGKMPGEPALWTLNGVPGRDLPKAPLFRAKRGSPVTLAFRNASPELVSFRVHGFAMRLLHDLDDGWEPYWRDSVLVPPGVTHHAAFLADLPGRWLIESPFFAQAAGGLRGWFEIT